MGPQGVQGALLQTFSGAKEYPGTVGKLQWGSPFSRVFQLWAAHSSELLHDWSHLARKTRPSQAGHLSAGVGPVKGQWASEKDTGKCTLLEAATYIWPAIIYF